MPADAVPGGEWREGEGPWAVLYGDGTWRVMVVRAWRKDRHGREVVDVEYRALGTMWCESFIADRKKMRD